MESEIVLGKDRIVFDGRFNQLIERPFAHNGKSGVWEVIKKKQTVGPTIGVVGITDDRQVVLTKIYRIPLKSWLVSFVTGGINTGESESEAAGREFTEETGFVAKRLERVAFGPFNPALTSDEMVLYIAHGSKKKEGAQKLDLGEDIQVLTLHLSRIERLLKELGLPVDIKLYAALYFLRAHYPLR